ncbi:Smr/MutS family protein [Patescibacteria group bacterium]|nr:Smr/MutS family protein [Patescibacteria group bacterium]
MRPNALIRLAELDESVCYILDLHESYLQLDPVRHVNQAIIDGRKMGKEVIKIIHGRGAGILQDKVRRFLDQEQRKGRIGYFRASDRLDELGAVIYVACSLSDD